HIQCAARLAKPVRRQSLNQCILRSKDLNRRVRYSLRCLGVLHNRHEYGLIRSGFEVRSETACDRQDTCCETNKGLKPGKGDLQLREAAEIYAHFLALQPPLNHGDIRSPRLKFWKRLRAIARVLRGPPLQ